MDPCAAEAEDCVGGEEHEEKTGDDGGCCFARGEILERERQWEWKWKPTIFVLTYPLSIAHRGLGGSTSSAETQGRLGRGCQRSGEREWTRSSREWTHPNGERTLYPIAVFSPSFRTREKRTLSSTSPSPSFPSHRFPTQAVPRSTAYIGRTNSCGTYSEPRSAHLDASATYGEPRTTHDPHEKSSRPRRECRRRRGPGRRRW